LPTTTEVDCFDNLICVDVADVKELPSSYISSVLFPSLVSDLTSPLIGSNVLIGCEVEADGS
jgi:hypothetical protein